MMVPKVSTNFELGLYVSILNIVVSTFQGCFDTYCRKSHEGTWMIMPVPTCSNVTLGFGRKSHEGYLGDHDCSYMPT